MIRSFVLLVVGLAITGVTCLYVLLGARFLRKGADSIHEIASWWGATILKLASVKLEVVGEKNLITNGPQLFMANHQSWFDIFIVLAGIPCQFRFLAKKELFEKPIFGAALYRYQAIPIDRKNFVSAMRSIEAAARQVKAGRSVMTFPEGTRSRDGQIQPFKKGVFHLALRAGVPVVPITIIGAAEIMPKKSLRVKAGRRVRVVIGEPVPVTDYTVENMDDLLNKVRNDMLQHYEAGKQNQAGG